MATIQQKIEALGLIKRAIRVPVTIINGAAAGTFAVPRGAIVTEIYRDTPVTIPGTPTNTNLRIGSSANGQQYVADVDVKAQGFASLTVVYAARNAAQAADAVFHYAVSSTGGTAADQDGAIILLVEYVIAG